MRERAGIQSVEVGFGLLQALGEAAGPLMLRDLARAANMSAAKAHRYLVSFQRLQLVVQDTASTRYDLGPAALKLGLASLSRLDAVRLARERITPLREQVGHTLALAVWGNHGPTIIHWDESPHAVTVNLRLGDVMPLLSSATGQCFAAHVPKDAIAGMLKEELARGTEAGARRHPHFDGRSARDARRSAPARRRAGGRHAAARHRRLLPAGVRRRRAHGARHGGTRSVGQFRRRVGWRRRGALARGRAAALERPGSSRMTDASAAPLRRLMPLTLLVLLLHGALLQVRTDDALLPGQEPLRTFSTRTLLAPPAPMAAAASPAAPAPPPRALPRPAITRAPVPRAPAPVEAAAPGTEEPSKMPTDTDSGGPALQPATVAASSAPASAVPGLPQVVALPVPARMRYEVTVQRYGITLRGDAEMDWRHDGSKYEVQLEVRSSIGSRTQRSTGRITGEGLAPDYFWERTRNEQATHFERERGRITFSNNRPAAPLAPGMQDRLSVVVQLSVLVAGDPRVFRPARRSPFPPPARAMPRPGSSA